MKKIRILFNGNFEIHNKAYALCANDVIEVSDEDADRLIVVLCAELLGNPPAEKPKKAVVKEEAE